METLDKFLVSKGWIVEYYEAEPYTLKGVWSYHWLITLSNNKGEKPLKIPFMFEVMSFAHSELEPNIKIQ